MPHRVLRPAAVATALAAVLTTVGCGAAEQTATSGQPSAEPGPTPATAPAGGSATAAATMPPTITMADLLVRALPEVDPRTGAFAALLPAGDVPDGMVTVFAPTDGALAAVEPGSARDLVRSHVARGRLEAGARPRGLPSGARLADGQQLTMLDGGGLQVAERDGVTVVIDATGSAARVLDSIAGDGWALHVVERVLQPTIELYNDTR
jgi:uncharacterized surface protein with fasciclin (FAS1) repeats